MDGHAGVTLYARVSTKGRQELETQLQPLRAEAQRRGWHVVAEHVDEGISGAESARPGLDAVMADVRAGRCDVVMVWRFDRWARSLRHLLDTLEELRVREVEFVSLTEQLDTSTPMGRMLFAIIAAIAEFERELIRERVIAGLARAKAEGITCGRPRKSVDITEAHRLLSAGLSQRAVAQRLNISRSMLSRRLAEERLAQKPVSAEATQGLAQNPGAKPSQKQLI